MLLWHTYRLSRKRYTSIRCDSGAVVTHVGKHLRVTFRHSRRHPGIFANSPPLVHNIEQRVQLLTLGTSVAQHPAGISRKEEACRSDCISSASSCSSSV